jgi:tRNA A-37 threonylcarbamoyl transferase component Bud32
LKRLNQQDFLALREGAEVLEADHYGDKVLRLADGSILKLFRRRHLVSSAALFPYARRFAVHAAALSELGIPVPEVIRVIRIPFVGRDAVQYQPLDGRTLRDLKRAGLPAQEAATLKSLFTRFVIRLHDQGVYFRSLHLGNVILTPGGQLGLIDFADLRIHPWSLGRYLRGRNMRRMLGIEEDRDWVDLDAIVQAKPPATVGA